MIVSVVLICHSCQTAGTLETGFKACSTTSGAINEDTYEDDIKMKILDASLPFVCEFGWSKKALSAGAQSLGYPGITHGMFARGGADLVLHFHKRTNLQLLDALKQWEKEAPTTSVKFTERALRHRLELIIPYVAKWPQAIALMALPPSMPKATATLLTSVDDICYYAGDRSVDFNWYVRRLGVAGVYKATELYLIQDKSQDFQDTWRFLSRRMEEAVQVHQILNQIDGFTAGPIAKDTVLATFTTARNLLGLNWTR